MKALLKATSSQLDFLIIGGHAAMIHGVARSTFDLDLLVCGKDRDAWVIHLISEHYRVFHETSAFLQFESAEGEAAIDLMMVNAETWSKMLEASELCTIGSLPCRVVSPLHLLALKIHALKFRVNEAAEKDWYDIQSLIKMGKIDPHAEVTQQILHRYGSSHIITLFTQKNA
jgi:hypothetical protein